MLKISILTVSFNSGLYIEKAINSVLAQDYPEFEHIVVDGGSTDGTVEILKRYPHLKWESKKDKGQTDAMNKAFKMSTGDVIVYLNSDDFFEPNIFKKVIETFQNAPVDFVVGDLYNRYTNSDREELEVPESQFDKILYPQRYHFPYNPVSYFYRRKVQESIGDFPLNEHYAMDYWFLLRAMRNFKVEKINIPLGTFLRTGSNKTSASSMAEFPVKRLAKEYVYTLGTYEIVKFHAQDLYFDVWHGIHHSYWKIPFKYLYYLFFAKRRFKTFKEFNLTGMRNSQLKSNS